LIPVNKKYALLDHNQSEHCHSCPSFAQRKDDSGHNISRVLAESGIFLYLGSTMKKPILISIVVFVLLVPLVVFLTFEGAFDKKYSQEWLADNFVQNEDAFSNLVNFFETNLRKSNQADVSFGVSRADKVSLIIYPAVVAPANKIIGGADLKLDSPELQSALSRLGWTSETVKQLKNELSRTRCDWIKVIEGQGNSVEIYPDQSGWGSYSYVIYREPVTDSMIHTYGKPLSNSGFGKRVVLNYTAAL
jgi:hypothetical protein